MTTGQIMVALVGLMQAVTVFLLSRVKRDTSQVNNAVNHITPGMPTLTQRVDVITEDMAIVKGKAIETNREINSRFDHIDQKTDELRGKLDSFIDNTAIDLGKIRESVDRRKEPRT